MAGSLPRTLVAAGTGWVRGAAGASLPPARAAAVAREGIRSGPLGVRDVGQPGVSTNEGRR
jgi:hypothetical protein